MNQQKSENDAKERPPIMQVIPDGYTDLDRIGYADHAAGLVEMVASVNPNKGSFTVGVFGEWGAGKTSLLRQIERALKEKPESHPEQRVLTVWFNPWQFAGEPHLIIPFFHTLLAALDAECSKKKGLAKAIVKKLTAFRKRLSRFPAALAYGLEAEFKFPYLMKMKWSADKSVKREEELDARAAAESLHKAASQYVSLYYRLIDEMRNAVDQLQSDGQRIKIAVFVDDLDRCLPEKAVELLEGLKVLLDLPAFVFVLGVSRAVIERGVRVRYKELFSNNDKEIADLERNYLDKIVQFPFALPPADPEKLVSAILREHLKPLGMSDVHVNVVYRALGHNPRTLKRFINTVAYIFWVANQKDTQSEQKYQKNLLLRACLLAYSFHELYLFLCDQPAYLLRLQRLLREPRKQKSEGDGVAEPAESQEKGLAIPEIDRYLKAPYRERLETIFGAWSDADLGFENENTAKQHLCLLAPTASAETKSDSAKSADISLKDSLDILMVRIPEGTFALGEGDNIVKGIKVAAFMLGKHPVTQELYSRIMGENPSSFSDPDSRNCPVETVTWFDAVRFCNRLSERLGLTPAYDERDPKDVKLITNADGYRLPSEAEWEYACRAGTTGERYAEPLGDIAWYDENSGGRTHPVGQRKGNAWGCYDILGNVWEWVEDDWKKSHANRPLTGAALVDQPRGSVRVFRGGSWDSIAQRVRSAFRRHDDAGFCNRVLGFRLSRSLP